MGQIPVVDDDAAAICSDLRLECELMVTRGIRTITAVAGGLRVPALGSAVRGVVPRLADLHGARDVGGFLVAIRRRR